MSKLDELEVLAKAATPGPWEVWSSNSHLRITADGGPDGGVCSAMVASDGVPVLAIRQENVEHIAACNPATVLAMVEVIRAAREMRDWYRKQMGPDGPEAGFDAALAKLEDSKQ